MAGCFCNKILCCYAICIFSLSWPNIFMINISRLWRYDIPLLPSQLKGFVLNLISSCSVSWGICSGILITCSIFVASFGMYFLHGLLARHMAKLGMKLLIAIDRMTILMTMCTKILPFFTIWRLIFLFLFLPDFLLHRHSLLAFGTFMIDQWTKWTRNSLLFSFVTSLTRWTWWCRSSLQSITCFNILGRLSNLLFVISYPSISRLIFNSIRFCYTLEKCENCGKVWSVND